MLERLYRTLVVVAVAIGARTWPATAQETVRLKWPADSPAMTALSSEDVRGLGDLVRLLLLQSLPHDYANSKEWGMTKEVWAGVDIKQDGLRLSTHSRRKVVNHGSWKRYQARLFNPDRELQIRLDNLRPVAGKGAGFDLVVDAHLLASGRWSEWRQGVQLFSVSADADARVRMRVSCEVGVAFRIAEGKPSLSLAPHVSDAEIELVDFRLQRISKLDGPGVHKLGHALRGVLQDEIDERRGKLVGRINAQIAKHKDVLTVSPTDLMKEGWETVWDRAVEFQGASAGASRD